MGNEIVKKASIMPLTFAISDETLSKLNKVCVYVPGSYDDVIYSLCCHYFRSIKRECEEE